MRQLLSCRSAGVFVLFCLVGCIPFVARVKAPDVTTTTVFRDAHTAATIPEVLVVPVYVAWSGAMLLDGPEADKECAYFARPFVYHSSDPFPSARSRGIGVVTFLPVVGAVARGKRCEGMFVVAPGYRAGYFGDVWERTSETKFELAPLPESEAKKELHAVSALLDKKTVEDADLRRWFILDMPRQAATEVRLRPGERKLIDSFIQKGLSQLDRQ